MCSPPRPARNRRGIEPDKSEVRDDFCDALGTGAAIMAFLKLKPLPGDMRSPNSLSRSVCIFRSQIPLVLGILLLSFVHCEAGDVNAHSPSLSDVSAAVVLAQQGDTVHVPAGTAAWATTLNIAKNITLLGAGEGKTVITENLPRSGSPPLINVSLSHDSPASLKYSFRLSGFTFTSPSTSTILGSDHAFITVKGRSNYVATPTAANPAPYVLGCVSRVRLDHLTLNNLNGLSLLVDSCLGVADHITQTTTTSRYTGYPIKVFHTNWTPARKPDNSGPMTTLATNGFGSWADDPYWGTDKFFFFEDCSFTVPDTTNVADNEEGARVAFRHCTFNGGGGLATHGMEGRAQPGIKQQEVYNNYYNVNRVLAQTRSGSILWFNNLLTAAGGGLPFYNYRQAISYTHWGTADGTCRYDNNAGGSPIYTGTVTATDGVSSITDKNQPTFSLIDISDGNIYSVNNLDDPFQGPTADPGWKYYHAIVRSVNGQTLSLISQASGGATTAYRSAKWAVGNHYEIRKVLAMYGQPGQGKGKLLNPGSSGTGYNTYFWPLTSGTKATYPQAGYPLEPCFAWNNTDLRHGQLGFEGSGTKNPSVKANRDYFNKTERSPLASQKVGYPSQDYARATSNYPAIGPSGTTPYTPYIYPHPLASDLSPPSDLQVVSGN
jgi:hypothetical protein